MNYIKIAKDLMIQFMIDELLRKQIKVINNKLNKFPLPFNYKIELSETDISDEDYVGQAMFSEQYDIQILPIAINIKLLADQFFNSNNKQYIINEIIITLWHEIAHGLIERINDDGYDIPFNYDDEDICQEFGQAKGQLNNSKLGKWIKQFDWKI